jgi:hypothetical protein
MPMTPKLTRRRQAQQVALDRYQRDLRSYLEQRGFAVLDLSEVDGLEEAHFERGDHVTAAGKEIFTRELANALAQYLPAPTSAVSPSA